MTSKSAVAALVPPAKGRDIAVDRTVNGASANLTDVVTGIVGTLKNSSNSMDDISVEVALHTDQARSSASIRFRAYRRADRREQDAS
jgi:hypothetical protein